MTAEEERARVDAVLGKGVKESQSVKEKRDTGGNVEIEVTNRWRPSGQEREALARLSVLGVGSERIAEQLGKSVEQVKYALAQPGQADYEQVQREQANQWVGFAMAQLQLAAPDSVNNALRIVRDTNHRDNARMTIWHLDTVLAPHIRQPEERHDFTINLSKQATEILVEGLLGYRERRLGDNNSSGTENIRHLRRGNEAFIETRVGLEPSQQVNQRLDLEGNLVDENS